jgi:hypothetical protein
MDIDESYLFWGSANAAWTPKGYRLSVLVNPNVGVRQLVEARTDLGERLSYLFDADVEELEVVAGSDSGLGHIKFVAPGASLMSVPAEQLRTSVDEALRNASARVAEQVAFENSEGAEWLKQLRGQA